MPRALRLFLLTVLFAASFPAAARPPVRWRVVVGPPPPPAVVVRVGPWRADWRPAPRPGWVWIPGHYGEANLWVPGHWEPAYGRAGYAWVPGHWVGDQWVEGYWREAVRPGAEWIEGHYDQRGSWVPGYWRAVVVAPVPPPAPPPTVVMPTEPAAPPAPAEPAPLTSPEGGDIHHDY